MATENIDDTEYLLSSDANKEHLLQSIVQEENGQVTKLGLDDVFSLKVD